MASKYAQKVAARRRCAGSAKAEAQMLAQVMQTEIRRGETQRSLKEKSIPLQQAMPLLTRRQYKKIQAVGIQNVAIIAVQDSEEDVNVITLCAFPR